MVKQSEKEFEAWQFIMNDSLAEFFNKIPDELNAKNR